MGNDKKSIMLDMPVDWYWYFLLHLVRETQLHAVLPKSTFMTACGLSTMENLNH